MQPTEHEHAAKSQTIASGLHSPNPPPDVSQTTAVQSEADGSGFDARNALQSEPDSSGLDSLNTGAAVPQTSALRSEPDGGLDSRNTGAAVPQTSALRSEPDGGLDSRNYGAAVLETTALQSEPDGSGLDGRDVLRSASDGSGSGIQDAKAEIGGRSQTTAAAFPQGTASEMHDPAKKVGLENDGEVKNEKEAVAWHKSSQGNQPGGTILGFCIGCCMQTIPVAGSSTSFPAHCNVTCATSAAKVDTKARTVPWTQAIGMYLLHSI